MDRVAEALWGIEDQDETAPIHLIMTVDRENCIRLKGSNGRWYYLHLEAEPA